mmetsp:Transcript_17472/g.35505  ORF Transcript_17472/g.35505 Transcript_17472/m.35505 type:complete len:181 (+) Transcript_17472:268-810(+)
MRFLCLYLLSFIVNNNTAFMSPPSLRSQNGLLFPPRPCQAPAPFSRTPRSLFSVPDGEELGEGEGEGDDKANGDSLQRELSSRLTNLTTIEELEYRVNKLKLEEANIERFKKAAPRFLPYTECKNWVHAWGRRWESKEEWEAWIADGEKRNSYIPSDPEKYYTKTGSWEGWEEFLGVRDA